MVVIIKSMLIEIHMLREYVTMDTATIDNSWSSKFVLFYRLILNIEYSSQLAPKVLKHHH